tara:strand:- start:291 stop:635 length:345 start_codon:yes stop_codon:yes gene_type:complete
MTFTDTCNFIVRLAVTAFAVYAMLEFASLSSIKTTSGICMVGVSVVIAFTAFFLLRKFNVSAQKCPTCNGITYVPKQVELMLEKAGETMQVELNKARNTVVGGIKAGATNLMLR